MAYKSKGHSDQTLSFLPKNWLEVQRSAADRDFKIMNQRMQSFKVPFSDLASSFNHEWDKLRKSSLSLGNFQTSESLLSKLKESQTHIAIAAMVESFAVKNLVPVSYTSSWNSKKITSWKPPPTKLESSSVRKALPKELCMEDNHSKEATDKLSRGELKFPVDWKEMKLALQQWQNSRKGRRQYSLQEWEPLRRLRVSLVELETTAAASRTPNEFFENLKKTEFFENTKKFMNIPMMISSSDKDLVGNDDVRLDVPELLESLVRQSEPLLNQLGVRKGFSDKICSALRSWKHHDQLVSASTGSDKDVVMVSREAGSAANELDLRIASVLNSTGYIFRGELWGGHTSLKEAGAQGKRSITIATTASLPWMTGTAINPLFRAAYLAKNGDKNVTLLIPWLSRKDQQLVYPNQVTFESPQDQERYIREWLNSRISFEPDFKIVFYPGKFSEGKRSILAVDDITQFIPKGEADIAILEEPEHLTWYHHGARWTQKFQHVVGIVHTNYLEYVKREKNGPFQAFLLKYVNNWVTSIYCHKVIRLSAATQNLPKSLVCNVHGVSPKFIEIGKHVMGEKEQGKDVFTCGAYFLGKMVWGKGYRELLDLWAKHKEELHDLQLDVFGNGEDSSAVKAEANKFGLQIKFYDGRDHADTSLQCYKVFINPSVSDVVCTTTAEALAMGKTVVCADHPSNEFFKGFPNCYMYKTSEEFVEKIKQAMRSEPLPLSLEQQHMLSWEAATERFLQASELDRLPLEGTKVEKADRKARKRRYLQASVSKVGDFFDYGMFLAHYCLSGIEIARLASGAIPGTMHMDEEQQRDLGLVSSTTNKDMQYSW